MTSVDDLWLRSQKMSTAPEVEADEEGDEDEDVWEDMAAESAAESEDVEDV